MLADLTLYSINKEFIQTWFLDQKTLTVGEAGSIIAVATNVPIIVCYFYMGEVSGWTKEILDGIEKFIDFYNYKVIVGIPESYPGRRL